MVRNLFEVFHILIKPFFLSKNIELTFSILVWSKQNSSHIFYMHMIYPIFFIQIDKFEQYLQIGSGILKIVHIKVM